MDSHGLCHVRPVTDRNYTTTWDEANIRGRLSRLAAFRSDLKKDSIMSYILMESAIKLLGITIIAIGIYSKFKGLSRREDNPQPRPGRSIGEWE
jgi:hypothetical protein